MEFGWPQALPLLGAIVFAIGALLIKRSADWRVDIWRTTYVANLTAAVVFLPLGFLGGPLPPVSRWWEPAFAGLLLFGGQLTSIVAMTRGDVSVAMPVLGLKVVLVAFLATLLTARSLPAGIWIAALLASLGVALLNWSSGSAVNRSKTTVSVCFGFLSALSYAICDLIVQIWAPGWGLGWYLPAIFLAAALYSLLLVAWFPAPLSAIPRTAWPWLLGGSILIALQGVAIVFTIACWQNAAEANVMLSTRGLWGVLFPWLLGPWLGVREMGAGRGLLHWRLAGAVLLVLAVVLASL